MDLKVYDDLNHVDESWTIFPPLILTTYYFPCLSYLDHTRTHANMPSTIDWAYFFPSHVSKPRRFPRGHCSNPGIGQARLDGLYLSLAMTCRCHNSFSFLLFLDIHVGVVDGRRISDGKRT
ncbi:hypothetical protein VFPPC_18041 [Pochonia chlamydosporia 170]|uniref:Uncharacterized protein n=1 Tax=Pochonia chlamydosporia 170 TaxID=1380566 RepID=A0A219APP3_METCM|nr:hypothetical protein VFPPC_18041 [Pochonia chlamydosporia 170]OWT42786.1 hypothetical protein VFPPC_18041 [Pochonia chlamydosporia 170]